MIKASNGEQSFHKQAGQIAFVHTSMDGTLVRANTWSGYAIWIDPETGRALKSEFVK
jgi:hypothetical protein